MALQLNKQVKKHVAMMAIERKYKAEYEKAERAMTVAARNLAVSNSSHEEFTKLNLPEQMMRAVRVSSYWELNTHIKDSEVSFINRIKGVSFDDPVIAPRGSYYLSNGDLKELQHLHDLSKLINTEYSRLFDAINSYRSIKKLTDDMPWVSEFLPKEAEKTGLIPKSVLDDINSKFTS